MFVMLLFFIAIFLIQNTVKNFFPTEIVKSILILFIFFIFASSVILAKGQLIFEYDISGEILSIKSYKWYTINKKIVSPVLEMPKKNLIKYEIEDVYLKTYLLLHFKIHSGKIRIQRVDITWCSRKEIQEMQTRFNTIFNHSEQW